MFIVKLKSFTHGAKILEFKSNWRHYDFLKSKIYTNYSNQNILEGSNFLGVKVQGSKIFRPKKMSVFALIIVFLTFLGLGVKFSRWG